MQHLVRLTCALSIMKVWVLMKYSSGVYPLQVTVHYRLKNEAGEMQYATECFECAPKQSRTKTYPVCTIRNTPDKPIHCIVWAKELLFARLFGRWVTTPLRIPSESTLVCLS